MSFTYSICEPWEKEIIYVNEHFPGKDIINIAKNYPWLEKLRKSDEFPCSEIYYNPSLDFQNSNDKKRFCLTANLSETNELEFSLWYFRPKKKSIFFGLLGEKQKMEVDDVGYYNSDEAIKYLEYFINGQYNLIEKLFY